MTDEADAPNVIQALRRVMRDLPGIGKSSKNEQQGYRFRGIEVVTAELQPLLARHGVVFTPRVTSWEEREIIVNNKPWTDQRLLVEYDVYGPGGVDDKITVGPVPGIGRDNSDKGSNKAMSQAFKYAVVQALSIGDKKDDADHDVAHERDTPVRPAPVRRINPAAAPSAAQTKRAMAMFGERGIKDRDRRLAYTAKVLGREIESWKDVTADEARQVIDDLAQWDPLDAEPVPPGVDPATGEMFPGGAA